MSKIVSFPAYRICYDDGNPSQFRQPCTVIHFASVREEMEERCAHQSDENAAKAASSADIR
jgi:hypothetical protein